MRLSMYAAKKELQHSLKFLPLLLVMLIFFLPFLEGTVCADGGLIPFHPFSVYEPGQKAIVAWDGETEIMILSVDVYSTDETKALHMVPFPSLPEVELGNISSFKRIEQIFNSYKFNDRNGGLGYNDSNPIEIVFHECIGPHNLTIIEVNSSHEFTSWVNNYLKNHGIYNISIPKRTDEIVKHYLQQDIRFYAIDVIDIDPKEMTVDPLIYTFKSDYLYFPLKISSIIEGDTEVTLAFITPEDLPVNTMQMRDLGFYHGGDIILANNELEEIEPKIASLMEGDVRLRYFSRIFYLPDLDSDIMLEKIGNLRWSIHNSSQISVIDKNDYDSDGKMELFVRSGNAIFVINVEDGSLLWEYDLQGYYCNPHLEDIDYDGKMEAIISTLNGLIVLNAENGSLFWKRDDISLTYEITIDDIDYDGRLEIGIFSLGYVHILNCEDGSTLWSFRINYWGTVISNVADLDLDGKNELIVVSKDKIYVLNGEDGSQLWNMSIKYNPYFPFFIEDFDLDGRIEIILYPCQGGKKIITLNGEDGTLLWEYNLSHASFPSNCQLEIGDIDSDGKKEMIIISLDEIHVLNCENGQLLWENRLNVSDNLKIVDITDVDFDGKMEIIIISNNETIVLNGEDGSSLWNHVNPGARYIYSSLVMDVDLDGEFEIITINNGITVLNGLDGSVLWDFNNRYNNRHHDEKIILCDIDLDGQPDIITKGYYHIFINNGKDGNCTFNFTSGEYIEDFWVCDIDNDGTKEIIVNTANTIYAIGMNKSTESTEPQPPSSQAPPKESSENLSYLVDIIVLFTLIMVLLGFIYNVKNRRILR